VKIVARGRQRLQPDRHFVTLKITTDDGLTGLGDGTLNGRELSVATYLQDHVVPLLLGGDAHLACMMQAMPPLGMPPELAHLLSA